MNPIFDSTKLKLTGLYLAIIMLITISFSFFIYSGVNRATEHALETQRRKIERQIMQFPPEFRVKVVLDPSRTEALLDIRQRVLNTLILINIGVLVASGSLGYYLAGKTLGPIEEMLTKQKRFISDAAHELKTPLTAIKTDLEVTLRDKNLSLAEAKSTLTRTVEEIDELALLTANLLSSSKYKNSDIYKKEIKIFNLNELIKKVIKKFSAKAKEKNVKITEELEEIRVEADQQEIEHVLMNILDNAIKYSENDTKVFFSLQKNKNEAEIKIEDQGIGISKKDLAQIFDPFYRADKSRNKSKVDGHGLGLAIAKDIIESYGGTIEAESKVGKGSTFIINLPLVAK